MRILAVAAVMAGLAMPALGFDQQALTKTQCMNAVGAEEHCTCIAREVSANENLAGMDFINYTKIASFSAEEQDARTNLAALSDEQKKQMEGYIAGIRKIQKDCAGAATPTTKKDEAK